MNRSFFSIVFCLFLMACDENRVLDQYQSLSDGWDAKKEVNFQFQQPKDADAYDLFINLRNDNNYGFNNLFLVVDINFPEGKVISDTLEYKMALPDGTWLGKGFSEVKENKLFYKEGISFPEEGTYNVSIKHAMRKNGEVNGVFNLEGVLDVGFRIEKHSK